MTEKTDRPWTVWTTQVFAGLMFAFLVFQTFITIGSLIRLPPVVLASPRTFDLILTISLACLYLAVTIGLALRSSVGRWFAVAALLVLCFAAFLVILVILNNGPYAVSLTALLFSIGSIPFFGFLAYRLARGSREKEFFSRPERANIKPPPPPSFDTGP